MPDSNHTAAGTKPTAKQLAYLRALAERSGQTFIYPQTRAEASKAIRRLRDQKPTPRADRVRERRQVSDDLANRTGDATRVLRSETTGYGSTASWKRGGR